MEDIQRVKIKITSNLSEELDLVKELEFTAENLNQAYIEQPAKFAYWATLAVNSKSALDKKKLEVERQENYLKKTLIGELDARVRHKMDERGERITEARVTSKIYAHPQYKLELQNLYELQDELLELQHQTDTLYAARDAFIQRKDMIISLGANIRQEKTNIEP